MKRILVVVGLWVALLAGGAAAAAAAAPMVLVYPRSESSTDTQYRYDYELLHQALEATVATHGSYELRQSGASMNQARAGDEIAAGSGLVNIFARSTTIEHEQRFLPIRIPIDKGLISYRVFLIRDDMQARFAAVGSLDDLRAYSVGSFPTWADTRILREGGFKVVTGDSYEGLFRMLVAHRFDFFSRSADGRTASTTSAATCCPRCGSRRSCCSTSRPRGCSSCSAARRDRSSPAGSRRA